MATFNVFKVDGLDMLDTDFFTAASLLPGNTTQFGWYSEDGTFWLATGVGFTFGPDGRPLTGVLTGLTASSGGNTLLQATGLSVNAAALMSGNMAGFYDTLMPGHDDLTFGNGDDVIVGTAGNDVIDAGGGNDTFHWRGGDGNDIFNGGYGANDMAVMNVSGQWELDSDWQQLKFRDSSDPFGEEVSIRSVDTLKVSTVEAGGDNLISVNHTGSHNMLDTFEFEGGSGNDRVLVDDQVSTNTKMDGGDGSDWLVGGRGDDELIGGDGNDVLEGQDGDDDLFGGAGSDDLSGGNGFDAIFAGAGNDFIRWRDTEGNDWVDGGDDHDTVWVQLSTDGDATLRQWHDYLEVNTSNDTIRMDDVETVEISTSGSSSVIVKDLSDSTMAESRIVFNDSAGDDTFNGQDATNALTFVRGLRGSAQTGDADLFYGGATDQDTLQINAAVGIDTTWIFGHSRGDWLSARESHSGDSIYSKDIEHVNLALGGGDDTIHITNASGFDGTYTINGGFGNDVVDVHSKVRNDVTFDDVHGDDTVKTGNGDDTFVYRDGYDQYTGGGGIDLVSFAHFNLAVYVNLSSYASGVWTRDSDDFESGNWRLLGTVHEIENVAGTVGSDIVFGNASDNTYTYVGAEGGGGLDRFGGRDGSDTVDFSQFDSAVQVDLSKTVGMASTRDGPDLGQGSWRDLVTLHDVENAVGTLGSDRFVGNAQDNTYSYFGKNGSGGVDHVSGGAGSDTADFSKFDSAVWVHLTTTNGTEAKTRDTDDLDSGSWRDIADLTGVENVTGTHGSDMFFGDANDNTYRYTGSDGSGGVDVFEGRGGSDTLDFSDFDSAVWADLGVHFGVEAWTRDTSNLSEGAWRELVDVQSVENLTGTDFNDRLAGDAGANRLDGGAGHDTLIGDGGNDTFVFADGYDFDTIQDFGDGDVIELSVDGIDNFADLTSHMHGFGDVVWISFGGGDTLQLLGQNLSNIDQDDFVFA